MVRHEDILRRLEKVVDELAALGLPRNDFDFAVIERLETGHAATSRSDILQREEQMPSWTNTTAVGIESEVRRHLEALNCGPYMEALGYSMPWTEREVGGEVAGIGHAPDGKPWRVGIQTPEATPGDALQTLPLSDLCIATSGNYRHRFEKDGQSYSHLIDPRTGRPIVHPLTSVSVIHTTSALADGYATALMILGPDRGRENADKLGLHVIWITDQSKR